MKKHKTIFLLKKITLNALLFAFTPILIVSCEPSLKVVSDYDRNIDFAAYKTFSVYNLKTTANVNQLNAERICNFISSEMTRKGYRETNGNPDLLVNAVSVVKDKKYVSANTNSGYGGLYRPYGYWGAGNTVFSVTDYKDGSLMIDVVDAKSNRLVWQGTGNAEITRQPKNPDEAISNTVTKILASFPPTVTNK